MLTSAARDTLRDVEAVIVDEIHALAATKRGAHLALTPRAARRALRPTAAAHRPVGHAAPARRDRPLPRRVRVDDGERPAPAGHDRRRRDAQAARVEVVVPVEDMGALGEVIDEPDARPGGRRAVAAQHLAVDPPAAARAGRRQHRSTLIFVNARRLAERLATRLNELAARGREPGRPRPRVGRPRPGHELVKAHHGSLSREQRLQIEDELKRGELKGLVATSSLELGIDMGAVDLVIQVESPGAVAAGLQRIGRAGHQVGEPSKGKLFPKHRGDLVEAAVVVQRMHDGLIEHTRYLRNPLDVLAQQIVAMCALDEWPVDELAALVRRAAPFAELTDEVLHIVLDLLAGRYPSDEFAELRPRIVWDRVDGIVRGRAGAQRLAVTSGGTIPDRGPLRRVPARRHPRRRARRGDGLREPRRARRSCWAPPPGASRTSPSSGSSSRRRPGQPGQDAVLARRRARAARSSSAGPLGAFVREVRADGRRRALERLQRRLRARRAAPPPTWSQYLDEQAEATGAVPDDRTIVVERFRDEIGDWRVCVLIAVRRARCTRRGRMALQARLAERWGIDVEVMWSDDGIVLRLPEAVDDLPRRRAAHRPRRDRRARGRRSCRSTALFASRFRECAARALLLPRRRPDRRTPLWQQRQKAADLLAVAAQHPTSRSCSRPPASASTTCSTCRRCARCSTELRSRRDPHRAGRHADGRRRSRSRCCSAGSRSTCTRATRRWPSAGPPRSRSTATCCATCSAPRSCASCSTRRCSPTSSSSCSASSTAAGPATPTSCTTCCGCSGR